jgi:hypothetical protein
MCTLRRIVLAICIVLASSPFALAAETGDITGVIRNQTRRAPQPGVKVTLLHFQSGGRRERTVVRTDERGRYAFEGLPTGSDHYYAIDSVHQGGLFQGGTHQIPDDTDERPIFEVNIKVWDTTDDPASVLLRRNDMFLVPDDNRVAVIDSYRLVNTTRFAYIGRGGAGSTTTVGFPLPADAERASVSIVNEPRVGIPRLRSTEFGFGITTAIPPGQTDFQFSYTVTGGGGAYELSKTALYPILDAAVFAKEPLEIRSNRVVESGPVTVGDDDYVRYSTDETIDAGDPIQLLAVAEGGNSPWLIVGAAIGMGVVALVIGIGALLRRRRKAPAAAPAHSPRPAPRNRDDVIVAIAELDLRYRQGDIDEHEWRERREQLKTNVGERAPEPTP